MKRILISNDDGINAKGILAAKKSVEKLGDVTIVAPDKEHSGLGRSLSVMKPLKIKKVKLSDNSIGYSVSGTPTDAVNIGVNYLMDKKPDLIIAGINSGRNISKSEITKSGTVGAALEAVNYNIPSIAISQSIDMCDIEIVNDEIKFINELNYDYSGKILYDISKKVLDKGLGSADLLNINVPSHPKSNKIKITRLCEKMFNPSIVKKNDNEEYYLIKPEMIEDYEDGTDGYALLNEGIVSLTPLKSDMTGNIEEIEFLIE